MIFKYDNYKEFLREWISSRPNKGRGEVGKIANFLNVSGSLISAILNGDRHISIEQAADLCSFLNLKKLESDFFIALVSYEKAGNIKLKQYWDRQKKVLLKKSEELENSLEVDRTLTTDQIARYYSHSAYSQIRILSTLENGISLKDLYQILKLSKQKIKDSVEFLIEAKIIYSKDERYFAGESIIHLSKDSEFYLQHHKNWRIQQLHQVSETTPNEVTYTSPCTIDEISFKKIQQLLLQTIKESHAIIRESKAKKLACLTIDWVEYTTEDEF